MTTDAIERTVTALEAAGFAAERFQRSINFKGRSKVSIQLSTEECYRDYPERSVAADVHGILLRVASLEDTLNGKMKAWADPAKSQSKRIEDLADVARLIEAHPDLWNLLSDDVSLDLQIPRAQIPAGEFGL